MLLNLAQWVLVVFPLLAFTPCLGNSEGAMLDCPSRFLSCLLVQVWCTSFGNYSQLSNRHGTFHICTSRCFLSLTKKLSESLLNLGSKAGLGNFLCKWPEVSQSFRLCGPYCLCWNFVLVRHKGSHQRCVKQWAWVHSSKTACRDTNLTFTSFSWATQYSFDF